MQFSAQLVTGGCKSEQNVIFRKDNFTSTRCTMYMYFKLIFIFSAKLLKTTTDGAASQKSNEIHLKLDNYQFNRISIDTSGLLATWPEFWAIGLSFLGLYS